MTLNRASLVLLIVLVAPFGALPAAQAEPTLGPPRVQEIVYSQSHEFYVRGYRQPVVIDPATIDLDPRSPVERPDALALRALVLRARGDVDAYRAARAQALATVSDRPVADPQDLNTGGKGLARFTGHVLTDLSAADGVGPAVLYAPSESDDPAYRADIATAIGGTCDYFDARFGNPGSALLSAYDCVHTWAN